MAMNQNQSVWVVNFLLTPTNKMESYLLEFKDSEVRSNLFTSHNKYTVQDTHYQAGQSEGTGTQLQLLI